MEQNIDIGVGFVPAPQFVNVPSVASCVMSAPALFEDSVSHLTVTNTNTFLVRQGVLATEVTVSSVSATSAFPALIGPNLAIGMSRIYTFFARVAPTTGTVTLSIGYGKDFANSRNPITSDFWLGNGENAIVGYLYIKNASVAAFIPGTTLLNVSGISATSIDQFGYQLAIS